MIDENNSPAGRQLVTHNTQLRTPANAFTRTETNSAFSGISLVTDPKLRGKVSCEDDNITCRGSSYKNHIWDIKIPNPQIATVNEAAPKADENFDHTVINSSDIQTKRESLAEEVGALRMQIIQCKSQLDRIAGQLGGRFLRPAGREKRQAQQKQLMQQLDSHKRNLEATKNQLSTFEHSIIAIRVAQLKVEVSAEQEAFTQLSEKLETATAQLDEATRGHNANGTTSDETNKITENFVVLSNAFAESQSRLNTFQLEYADCAEALNHDFRHNIERMKSAAPTLQIGVDTNLSEQAVKDISRTIRERNSGMGGGFSVTFGSDNEPLALTVDEKAIKQRRNIPQTDNLSPEAIVTEAFQFLKREIQNYLAEAHTDNTYSESDLDRMVEQIFETSCQTFDAANTIIATAAFTNALNLQGDEPVFFVPEFNNSEIEDYAREINIEFSGDRMTVSRLAEHKQSVSRMDTQIDNTLYGTLSIMRSHTFDLNSTDFAPVDSDIGINFESTNAPPPAPTDPQSGLSQFSIEEAPAPQQPQRMPFSRLGQAFTQLGNQINARLSKENDRA